MSSQMKNLLRQFNVKTEEELKVAIQESYERETGERPSSESVEVILDEMLEAEYQRIEGGAYD